jgi:RNA polymerase sigma-70 factor (ECF subfamily)
MAINQAMKRLNPKHRMVFILYEVEGLKHAEVATAMDIPEGTSKAWLFEAKRELKRMLSEVQK